MTNDTFYIFSWWLLFFIIGVSSIPLAWVFFKKFTDLGYGFTKTGGLLVITFSTFLLSISHALPFTNTTLYLVFLAYISLNVFIFAKNRKKITRSITSVWKVLLAQEILFTIGLIFWSTIRGYQPDINGLEKFMDFGFINSLINTRYLPPVDMWFAGNPINYYWFGHLSIAVATKLSTIPSSVSYNLALASILGFTLTGAFSISSSLIKNLKFKTGKRTAFAAGIISAILLTFAGNFHAPIYIIKEGHETYWYPDATRLIGYNPETQDKTIHEFPIYSFVVSDLHAHLINFPFVLLYIGLLFNYTLAYKANHRNSKLEARNSKQYLKIKFKFFKKLKPLNFENWNLFRNSKFGFRIFPSKIIPLGFLLGVMVITNTWDFGNYLLLTGISLLIFTLKYKGVNIISLWKVAKSVVIILILALITALPLLLNFKSITEGISLVNNRSPLWQLGVLWGFPAVLTLVFTIFLLKVRKRIERSDIFIIALFTTSWILIVIPEIVFVKDIYIASHQRANTMFKLTYQAFVMFYLSSGYISVRIIAYLKKTRVKILAFVFFVVLFSSVLIYPSFAINSFYGDLKNYKGLEGDIWLKNKFPGEYRAVTWLKENTTGQPTILEAPGDSYTEFNVISSYTGLPTISGWFVHEWLWRGNASVPRERVSDIEEIYTGSNAKRTKSLLETYSVKYVIIGTFEHQKYPNLNEEMFTQLGTQVFSSGNTSIYKLNF